LNERLGTLDALDGYNPELPWFLNCPCEKEESRRRAQNQNAGVIAQDPNPRCQKRKNECPDDDSERA
jgi:hypothetical protein